MLRAATHTNFTRLHLSMERWEMQYLWGGSSWQCVCCTVGLCWHHGCFTPKPTAWAPSWSLASISGMKINSLIIELIWYWTIHLWKSLVAPSFSQGTRVGHTLWREGMSRGELGTHWATRQQRKLRDAQMIAWEYSSVCRRKAGLKSALGKAKGKC